MDLFLHLRFRFPLYTPWLSSLLTSFFTFSHPPSLYNGKYVYLWGGFSLANPC